MSLFDADEETVLHMLGYGLTGECFRDAYLHNNDSYKEEDLRIIARACADRWGGSEWEDELDKAIQIKPYFDMYDQDKISMKDLDRVVEAIDNDLPIPEDIPKPDGE